MARSAHFELLAITCAAPILAAYEGKGPDGRPSPLSRLLTPTGIRSLSE